MIYQDIPADRSALVNWSSAQKAHQARACRILIRRRYVSWRMRKYHSILAALFAQEMDAAYRELAQQYLRGAR
jgi:hypothetical protein